MFLFPFSFLKKQYYVGFSEDAEVPYLRSIGLFSILDDQSDGQNTVGSTAIFPTKILKKRLEMFLQVFAAVTSPKQMYCHQLLYSYYQEILAKADVNTVKLAFDCILTYKPAAITPYKDNIKRMLEDKTLRDELVNFDPSPAAVIVSSSDAERESMEHRAELVPLLVRIVYGRFTSKSRGSKAARDQNLARYAYLCIFLLIIGVLLKLKILFYFQTNSCIGFHITYGHHGNEAFVTADA